MRIGNKNVCNTYKRVYHHLFNYIIYCYVECRTNRGVRFIILIYLGVLYTIRQ